MKELFKKAFVISIIAGLLVIFDGIITYLMGWSGSYVWVSFISWTVFFGATLDERILAIPGYVVGFILAVTIMNLGNFLEGIINLKIIGIAISSVFATVVINFISIYFEKLKKFYLNSINGIFVGIALTFSTLGVGLQPNTLNNSITMILIILLYGILGLLSGFFTLKFTSKK